mmetsp:Transcript_61482/g.143993  ORF Transcript_61482/g.143993 Transcript_61482/m.143993 type:complete len:236 (-) Transcript_61482:1202-1909(-)
MLWPVLRKLYVMLLCCSHDSVGDVERCSTLDGCRQSGCDCSELLPALLRCQESANADLGEDADQNDGSCAQKHLRDVQLQYATQDARREVRPSNEDADFARRKSIVLALVQNLLHGPGKHPVHCHEALHPNRLARQIADQVLAYASQKLRHRAQQDADADGFQQAVAFFLSLHLVAQNDTAKEVHCCSWHDGQHEHSQTDGKNQTAQRVDVQVPTNEHHVQPGEAHVGCFHPNQE